MKKLVCTILMAATSLSGCIDIQEPQFREIRGFHIEEIELTGVRIRFGMVYFNPNEFSVAVKETAAKVYLDSVYLGDFKQDTLVDVRNESEFVVPLSGKIPLASFADMNIHDLLKRQVSVRAEGSTKVGKAGVFIRKRIYYQGHHRLERSFFP